jgi:hypothetical protein
VERRSGPRTRFGSPPARKSPAKRTEREILPDSYRRPDSILRNVNPSACAFLLAKNGVSSKSRRLIPSNRPRPSLPSPRPLPRLFVLLELMFGPRVVVRLTPKHRSLAINNLGAIPWGVKPPSQAPAQTWGGIGEKLTQNRPRTRMFTGEVRISEGVSPTRT